MILGFIDGIDNKSNVLRAKMSELIQSPDLTAKLDLGLNTMPRNSNGASENITNNTTNTNESFVLQIDNFYNQREQDIENLVEEIEFYRKKKALAKGGV